MGNLIKTGFLLAVLTCLLVLVGGAIGGQQGMTIAFILAFVMNVGSYWFSDKIVLSMYGAQPVDEARAPGLYRIVRELAAEAKIPVPPIYLIPDDSPNAFATGRNPNHAAVSVTKGILQILDQRELRGVLAHELSHVMNRDILISSIAAAIGMSITFLARFAFFFGGGDDDRGGGALGMLFAWILAPIAAAIIQMAVSRSREYQADESGALLSQDPEALASALRKLEASAKQVPVPASVSPAEAHMFIVNPFGGRRTGAATFANLFSTHPPTDARVARLEEIRRRIGAR